MMKKIFAGIVAASLLATAALAQNAGTVTNHAFALGKGPNVTGYTSLLCGSAQLAVGQAAADPICRTITGDWTISAAGVATLATVNGNVGTFGSATNCITTTQNAKGLTTAISAATCTPAVGSITGLGTGVATALGVNVGTAGAFVVNGGALGTPSSGVGTNLTGTASGLTAGNVTTNANLTGPVTSAGNATAIGANQVTRAMEAQGIARSVIGVTGNAGANVADIQGTANQALVVNSGGTALTFGQVNLAAAAAVTGTLPIANGGTNDTGTAWGAFVPAVTCGTATFTLQSARFKTLGKTVFLQVEATMTALGTCTNIISFTLPNTPQSGGSIAGRDTGFSGFPEACAVIAASATASCSLGNLVNWTNAAKLVISGVYESQ